MNWYFALCQHPMYMIIEHDETAAERTPPWGEPDIHSYVERIRSNLSALDRYPQLKFNYDLSGVELEGLAERAPDVVEKLRRLARAGRVGFVNGSYAQGHLHCLGAESNLRQMTEGLAAIERITGVRVRTYAHQEPAIHDQMPQLLRALDYRFAVTPGFFWVISFFTPHEILGVQYQGLRFIQDEEFTRWRGLDQSEIPLYLTQPRIKPKGGVHGSDSHRDALRNEFVKDFLHYPPIRCDFPDMVDIDDGWMADHAGHEFVVLEEALSARHAQSPSRSSARLYTYWGYGDGIDAECLHRADRRAEAALLEAEGLGAMAHTLVGHPVRDLTAAWRTLLKAQHHDAYWVGGVGLREKAVGWANEANHAAEAAIREAIAAVGSHVETRSASEGTPFIVWEPWPMARTDVATFDLNASSPAFQVRNSDGVAFPAQIISAPSHEESTKQLRLMVLQRTNGFGYQVLEAAPADVPQRAAGSLHFENELYRARLEPDGTFASLQVRQGDVELVQQAAGYRGNMLRAQSAADEWLAFAPTAEPLVESGPVCQRIEVRGAIGGASVTEEIFFYHHLPRIDITLTFDFHDASFGNYWRDESKLNVYWPVAVRGEIYHDIPFGMIRGRAERSFFPTTWVRLGSDRVGLAVFHRGTNRFWVRDNVLANVIACGVVGRDVGTRAVPNVYIKDFDLRLRGRHAIHYAIYPYGNDAQQVQIPLQALAYQHPLRVTVMEKHRGTLSSNLSLARLENESLVPTAMFHREGALVCRLFESSGQNVTLNFQVAEPLLISAIRNLANQAIENIPPFTIAEIEIRTYGDLGEPMC